MRFRIRTKPDALVSGVDITLHPASNRDERPRTTRVGMPKGTVLTMISNGSDSVLFVGPDGNLANALHLAVDKQGRILGGLIPISGTKILSVDASR